MNLLSRWKSKVGDSERQMWSRHRGQDEKVRINIDVRAECAVLQYSSVDVVSSGVSSWRYCVKDNLKFSMAGIGSVTVSASGWHFEYKEYIVVSNDVSTCTDTKQLVDRGGTE